MSADKIIEILQTVNTSILLGKNVSAEDLKILLLIIYNECLIKDKPDNLVKSYLTVTLDNFIRLENSIQQQNNVIRQEENTELEDTILKTIIHGRAPHLK